MISKIFRPVLLPRGHLIATPTTNILNGILANALANVLASNILIELSSSESILSVLSQYNWYLNQMSR